MIPIILKSEIIVVTGIKKKTKAVFFKDIKVGDRLYITYVLEHLGGASGGGRYASYPHIFNLTQSNDCQISQTNMVLRLSNFELEEVEED